MLDKTYFNFLCHEQCSNITPDTLTTWSSINISYQDSLGYPHYVGLYQIIYIYFGPPNLVLAQEVRSYHTFFKVLHQTIHYTGMGLTRPLTISAELCLNVSIHSIFDNSYAIKPYI